MKSEKKRNWETGQHYAGQSGGEDDDLLARSEAPEVIRLTSAKRKGVTSLPFTFPSESNRARAAWIASSITRPSASWSAGMGTAMSIPPPPSTKRPWWINWAACVASVTRYGVGNPLDRVKKAGNSTCSQGLSVATQTPWVSKYSSVLPISRMDFTCD